MLRVLVSFAAVSGLVTVVMGAFGAHLLKSKIESEAMHAFETAVAYQMSHTLLLFVIALFIARFPHQQLFNWAAYMVISGIILFCGSLYGLSIGGYKMLGPITPLGGLAFMAGWTLLAIAAWRSF